MADSIDNDALKQAIDTLIALLGEDATIARPAEEHAVLEQIRQLLDRTRDQRTAAERAAWETYLPYAARRCGQLARLEEGWEDELDYFTSENSQFWLDCANADLERNQIATVKTALARVVEAARLMKRDRIAQVDILLQALEIALEISDQKVAVQLYEEAEKVYRKHLAGGSEFTGSAWLRKIKKMGQQLARGREQLRRYYHYAESVTVSIEAASAAELERVLDYLQQSLVGKVKVTRRPKEDGEAGSGSARARVKITLD